MSIPDTTIKKDDMNQSQNLTNSENKTQSEQNSISKNETKLSTEAPKESAKNETKIDTKEVKENKENLNPNESKENKDKTETNNNTNNSQENKEQAMNVESDKKNDINTNIETPSVEKKEEVKTEIKENNINANLLASINQNNHEYIVDPRIQKKKNIKKEIFIIHAIQNYIIRNSYQKMVKAVLLIDDVEFDENIKNEKFLKLVREKLGPEKLIMLMIKSQRGLQKFFIKTRKPRRDPHKSAMTYINRLNNMNNNSMDMNSSYYTNTYNTYNTYSSNANTNYSSNMTNGISSMNNTYNFFKDNSMSYKPREQRPQQEDLSKEIKDLMNNKNAQKQNSTTKTDDINNTSNTNGTTPNGEGGKNSKNTTPSKKSKLKQNNMELENAQKTQGNPINDINAEFNSMKDNLAMKGVLPNMNDVYNNPGNNRFNSPMNSMTMNNNLGLSVHLHKDDRRNIFKYYMHHYGQDGSAAFYCSDKRCTGSAKYNIDSKKFEIVSEHSIPYTQHCYVIRPFPNDQRLFKEFEKRNYTEAQLFKQPNGRSNIYWYNN